MRQYIVRRLLLLIPIMLGVSFLTFAAFRIIPGDATHFICPYCPEDQRQLLRHELGIDRSWAAQYMAWLTGLFTGDFGSSYFTHLPVTTELAKRLPVTGELMVLTIFFSLILGLPLGIISAVRPNTPWDWIARFVGVLWLSVPSFYTATLAIVFGLLWFGWAPPQFGEGYVSFFDHPLINLEEFVLPSLILAFGSAGFIMRLTRSSILEVMRNDYIRTAWAKGLRERAVIWRHALKNALMPVLTVIGLEIGGLIGGAVIMESIFGLNGVGVYILRAVITRDILVVQTMALLSAIVYVLLNLLVDIGYAWLDPRIRYS
ncbi:MAG TPA: ABC transporter permease [Dehalococcoidia bacterium]|nr:ABC transporter permease [Dehalococcoidia bacterium]